MRALLLAGVVALGWISAAYADVTYTDTWSFTDQNGGTVSGTLSGIQNGMGFSPSGLTATVTQASYADLLGSYVIDVYGQANSTFNTYSAVNGVVTSINLELSTSNNTALLHFGTNPQSNGFFPQVSSVNTSDNLYNLKMPDTFAAQATPVPEPASMALLGVGALGVLAAVRRRRGVGAG